MKKLLLALGILTQLSFAAPEKLNYAIVCTKADESIGIGPITFEAGKAFAAKADHSINDQSSVTVNRITFTGKAFLAEPAQNNVSPILYLELDSTSLGQRVTSAQYVRLFWDRSQKQGYGFLRRENGEKLDITCRSGIVFSAPRD